MSEKAQRAKALFLEGYNCAQAVAEARTPEYYKKRPCPELVALAAQILEEWLAEHPARL